MKTTVTKSRDELLQQEYVNGDELAVILGLAKRTVLECYAPQPDFPPRIFLSPRKYFWETKEIRKYFERKREIRKKI